MEWLVREIRLVKNGVYFEDTVAGSFCVSLRGWRQPLLIAGNTLRARQNGRRFPDDIFKNILLNENV